MELVEVEITALVITARYGTLSTGDILKTDQAFADHLVNECKGAKWRESTAVGTGAVDDRAVAQPEAVADAPAEAAELAPPDPVAPAPMAKASAKPSKVPAK